MKVGLFYLFFILLVFGCAEKPKQSFYDLINDNFFTIVDSAAYKSGRLIQIPNDTFSSNKIDEVCILIDTMFGRSLEWKKSLLTAVKGESLKDFEAILLKENDSEFDKIELSNLKNTGRFTLINANTTSSSTCSSSAGKISFYKPYINEDKAIVIFSISESSKAGYTTSLFFRKQNRKWEIMDKVELERW